MEILPHELRPGDVYRDEAGVGWTPRSVHVLQLQPRGDAVRALGARLAGARASRRPARFIDGHGRRLERARDTMKPPRWFTFSLIVLSVLMAGAVFGAWRVGPEDHSSPVRWLKIAGYSVCLLYTSDAADE